MKTTFAMINTGDESPAQVSLQVSYFVNSGEQVKVESQEFPLSVAAGQESAQEVDFGDSITAENEVFVIIKKTGGSILTQRAFLPEKLDGQRVELRFTLNQEGQLDNADAPAELSRPSFMYGRLLDRRGLHKMEEVQIIILAKKDPDGELEPITSVKTESQGYFAIEYPLGAFLQAAAQVGLKLAQNPVPIRLEEKEAGDEQTELVFPRRVILVVEFPEEQEQAQVNEGDCGCSSLKFEGKRVLEEFSYYSLVRTSEPAIKGITLKEEEELTLEDVLRNLPFSIFEVADQIKTLPFIVRESPLLTGGVVTGGVATTGTVLGAPLTGAAEAHTAAASPATTTTTGGSNGTGSDQEVFLQKIKGVKIQKRVLRDFLNDEKVITKDNIGKLFAYNESARFRQAIEAQPEVLAALGRVVLNERNTVDWDEEPTIYQAVEVAHGHLLQFKSEWIEDGYSLGDLLYSLPLAPGQKKQIVVFDWERRESASNIQSVDFEESLFNSLGRDRDVVEIAKGTISESLRGSSRATTGGASAGIGGIIGGVLFGVSGGFGTSNSTASQDNFRQVSSSDQQKLRDRIVQSANAVRSLRSTVIQTVSQGERFEVSSETVANYNHCHALTIQYYEVLRHFQIRQRFVDARECLFIPLLMSQFDLRKALRWREALQTALLDKRYAPAFEAAQRVEHEWKDSDFPSGTFASEKIVTASGVLNVKIVLRRPIDKIEEVLDLSKPVVANNTVEYPFFKKVSKIIPENWAKLIPFLGSLTPEQFYDEFLAEAPDKDAVFHRELGEKIARKFFELLTFHVIDENNHDIGTIPIDVSLASRYYRDGVHKVTLRLTQSTSFSRDKLHTLQIRSKVATIDLPFGLPGVTINLANILPDGSYLTVESGFMRYRTKHFEGPLFSYQYLGDDLTASDGVSIYAGPSNEELKDPRKEDVILVNKLIAHLNDNLEYYHKAIWLGMTLERRFMLLDGISLDGKGEGRSVASLVENELIGIVGNSLVFPVAPGLNLDPNFGLKESLTDFYMVAAADPISVCVPTKGVYAEAVMGQCNSCEEKDESRFWRWEESPIPDSPTAILPIDTSSRRTDPGNLQPTALPNPIVNIQNAPNVPDPTGLSAVLQLLGKGDSFRDITGLTENQKNALAALQSTLENAKAFGQEAAKLEVQKTMERRLDTALNKIKNSGLPADKQADLTEKAINAYLGGGAKQEEKPKTDQQKAEGAKAKTSVIKDAMDAGVISPQVGEHLAASSLQHALFGASEEVTPGTIEAQDLLSNPALTDRAIEFENGTFRVNATSSGAQTGGTGAGGGGGSVPPWALSIDPFPTTPAITFNKTDPKMTTAFAPVTVSSVNHLCAALVDLTGATTSGSPPYAGLHDEEMVFAASMVKICAMYAAFALRSQVQAFVNAAAANGAPVVAPAIITQIEKAWKPKVSALFPSRPTKSFGNNEDISFPKLDQIFTFSPDGKVEFARVPLTDREIDVIGEFNTPQGKFYDWMVSMMRWSSDEAASRCILALGYFYINGALAQAGLFSANDSNGLWLSADYDSHDWVRTQAEANSNAAGQLLAPRWATAQNRQRSNITATAAKTARFMTLLVQGKLVKPDDKHPNPKEAMLSLMRGAIKCITHSPPSPPEPLEQCGIGSYVEDALLAPAINRQFTSLASKKGFGDDSFSHECAFVERTVDGKQLKYVVVGLGSAPEQDRRDLSDLFVLLDDVIVTRNK